MKYGVAAALIVAFALRAAAILDGFWLDEIWSYLYARDVHSVADVFTKVRSDNNHPLNTIWMWVIGDQLRWWVYRLPSVAAGIATVALAGAFLAQRGRVSAIVGMTLFAVSFPMLVYSTEARGYALAVCCAMCALVAAVRSDAHRGWALVFAIACMLGPLAHLTFIPFLLALLIWTALRAARSGRWPIWAAMNVGPLVFLTWYYLFFIRHLEVGGGPKLSLSRVFCEAASLVLGMPQGNIVLISAIAVATACGMAATCLWRRNDDRLLLYLLAILICPMALVALRIATSDQYVYLYPRYFVIPVAMILILLAEAIGFGIDQGRFARPVAIVALVALIATNLYCDMRFLRAGRGDYLGAMRYIDQHTSGPVIRIASDNNYRGRMGVAFYSRYLPEGRKISFYTESNLADLPQWMIVHSDDPDAAPEPTIGPPGARFELAKTFPHYGPSGWTWHVYERKL